MNFIIFIFICTDCIKLRSFEIVYGQIKLNKLHNSYLNNIMKCAETSYKRIRTDKYRV